MKQMIRYLAATAMAALSVTMVTIIALLLRQQPDPGEGVKHFRDIAEQAGLTWQMKFLSTEQGHPFKVNLYDHGSGIAVGDADGDGRDDIYLLNQLGVNALYRNKGDGAFEDIAQKAGVALGDRVCTMATFVDYANEGRQSLFVTSTRGGNVLFRNRGDGTFEDVTKEVGLHHVGHSQAGYFFDLDNDGYLDLLVLQTGSWTTNQVNEVGQYFEGKGGGADALAQIASSPREFNLLYHNQPDGKGGRRFVDITDRSGLKGAGWAADAAFFDYDNDGRVDVLITSMFGPAQLYRNEGGRFTEVTQEVLGRTPAGGMGVRVFDSDNDGLLDVYIVDMHSDMWFNSEDDPDRIVEKKKHRYMFIPDSAENNQKARDYEKRLTDMIGVRHGQVVFGNSFHRNLGGGEFEEISDQANLETFWPWGIATGDFDNDGYEDVFLPSGMGYPWIYWPNRLLMNNGNRTFRECSASEGIEPPARGQYLELILGGKLAARSSRAAAVGDFDGDGRLEIVVNNFNDRPSFFQSSFPVRNYLALRLRGSKSNRDAIGAVVRVHTGKEILTRQVDTAGGYLSQSSKTLHFGLGERKRIDKIEITWPGGVRQVVENLALNRLHQVEEPR